MVYMYFYYIVNIFIVKDFLVKKIKFVEEYVNV